MIRWRKARAIPLPQTVMGQWLLAAILVQRDRRDQLARLLNGGRQRGWNDDEPAVVEAVCQIAARKLFPDGAADGQAAAFTTRMRELFLARKPEARLPGQEETESVIHAALADQRTDLTRFRKSAVLHARAAVIAGAASKLGLSDDAITQMIVDGERIAFERGWHPPLGEPTHR